MSSGGLLQLSCLSCKKYSFLKNVRPTLKIISLLNPLELVDDIRSFNKLLVILYFQLKLFSEWIQGVRQGKLTGQLSKYRLVTAVLLLNKHLIYCKIFLSHLRLIFHMLERRLLESTLKKLLQDEVHGKRKV